MRDGWVETSLDDVFESCKNGKNYKEDENQNGLPITRIQTIADGTINLQKVGFGNLEEVDCLDFLLREGDILFSHINSLPHVGKVAFVTDEHLPLVHGMNLLRMRFKSSCDSKFMFYLMQHLDMREKVRSIAQIAVNQVSVNITNLRSLRILLPPLPEQKRIVDLISSVDSYIEALQQQLERAKRSRNAVLHELLSAGGEDWVETTLGQEFEICKNGKNYKDGISTEGLPISRIQTIASGKIDLTKVGFGNLFLEDAEGFLLEEGDILFSHINSLPHVGKVAIVQPNHLPLIHGMNLLRMRFTDSNDTKFMFYLMQNESMRDEIKSRAQVAVNQVSINISNIKTIRIVIPPLRTQREIASLIDAWENLIEECENNLNSSRNLRVGLLSQLLSGEHEIPASYDKLMGAAS